MRRPRRTGRGVGRPGAARAGREGRATRAGHAGRVGRPRPVAPLAALRTVLAVLVVLAVLATVGGCTAGDGGSGDGADDGAFTSDGDPNAIVIASGRDITGRGGVRQQLVDAWNERSRRSGSPLRARLVELPGTADQQRSQLLGALQSGSSHYDVVNLDVTWVPEFADGHLVRELDDALLDGDVLPSVAATGRWRGSTYAVPFNSDVGLLYYRPDYLRAAGVNVPGLGPEPTTWVGFRNLKQAVLRAHGRGELPAAYAMPWTTQLSSYEGLTVNGIEAFATVGASGGDAPLVDDEGRYVGTEEQLRLGLGEFTRRIDRAYTLDSAQESDEARLLADFAAGKTAFLRHWPYAYGVLHQDLRDGRLGLAALPGKAVLGGQNLAVTRHAPAQNLDAIEDLLRFLTGRNSERCLLEAGFAATRASAYEEGGARCPRGPARSATSSPTGEDADPMPRTEDGRPRSYAVVRKALHSAVLRPRTPLYGAFTQVFADHLSQLTGDDPDAPEKVARDLHRALRRALPADR
ncbi:extracellular solute-binding protein [Streptomyces sp. AC536]|nr:extracellular solute-binding protein [Streptomyces buecherae]QNJ42365.1 extracellular solute-binding protein [Streptomyces buecherae]